MVNMIESGSDSTDHLLMSKDKSFLIENLFNSLTDKQEKVIRLYFGIGVNGGKPMNLSEVGYEIGVSRERVRQIKDKSLKILKINSKKLGLNDLPF